MRKLIFAALLAGTAATPALAQDAPDLSGFRVEGIVGYDRADVEDRGHRRRPLRRRRRLRFPGRQRRSRHRGRSDRFDRRRVRHRPARSSATSFACAPGATSMSAAASAPSSAATPCCSPRRATPMRASTCDYDDGDRGRDPGRFRPAATISTASASARARSSASARTAMSAPNIAIPTIRTGSTATRWSAASASASDRKA